MARHRRKFTVLDALFLIAAIAIGLAWTRYFQNSRIGSQSYPLADGMDDPTLALRYRLEVIRWWVASLSCCMEVVTIALLILRFQEKPRKRLRYLARFPGAVAGGAVLLTLLWERICSTTGVLIQISNGLPFAGIWHVAYLSLSGQNAGAAVAVAWVLLATSGRWRRKPDWLDIMGIASGVFWLLEGLFSRCFQIVYPYPM
jgi:hypothetical protein